MDSCPVCYEAFSTDTAGTVARKLPCEHVSCTQCFTDSWETSPEGSGVRCPECFSLFLMDSVQSVPVYVYEGTPEGDETSNGRYVLEEEASATGDSLPPPRPPQIPEEASANASPGRNGNSKLAAFLSTNKAENHVGPTTQAQQDSDNDFDLIEEDDDGEGARPCKEAGCPNRAVRNARVCPAHTKRLSVVSVSAMVHKFKDTKLTTVALKSDKVEVKEGGVASHREAGFDPDAIAERFRRQERLELGEAVELIESVKNILREDENMVKLEAPVTVVGDVHGQYFDLLNILKKWRPDTRLLFLGDYVDRGQFSCEVILHLFALKLRYPDKVHLIRGNHECSSVSAHFGFKDECKAKYGLTVYYRFLLAFQTMPICALIATTKGRIFACHGGISPEIKSLSDIENIDRFAEPEMDGPLCDMLWADPMNEDDSHKLTDEEYQHFLDTDYIANQVRGCSYMFGYHAVQRFLRENRLMYMVRAHEVQELGFRSHFPSPAWALAAAATAAEEEDFTDEDSDLASDEELESYDQVLADTSRHLNPTVLTVFSAPNYCDRYRNKAAVLHIESVGYYTVNLLEAEPHPDPVQESDMNVMQLLAMGNTCPYMPTSFREFLKVAVQLGRAVKPSSAIPPQALENAAPPERANPAEVSFPETKPAASGGIEESETDSLHPNRSGSVTGVDGGSEVGVDNGEDPPLSDLSTSDKIGVSRTVSAPAMAVTAGWRKSSLSSVGSSVFLDDDGSRSSVGAGMGRRATVEKGAPWEPLDEDTLLGAVDEEVDEETSGEAVDGEAPGQATAEDTASVVSNAGKSFLGAMTSLSRRSMRGLGLSRQNTWSVGVGQPAAETSEQYRKAHARDGINEMHPEVLNRRISSQDSEAPREEEGHRRPSSTTARSPPSDFRFTTPTLEELLFGPNGLRRTPHVTTSAFTREDRTGVQGRETETEGNDEAGEEGMRGAGGDLGPSPAPPVRSVRRQFTLDMSVVNSPRNSTERKKESKSREEVAAMLSTKSIADLAQMESDVELDFEGSDRAESGAASEMAPSESEYSYGMTSSLDIGGSCPINSYTPVSRGGSFDHEHGLMTPSPRSARSSLGESSPSQMLFTHEEIVVLKLLFSLFDRKSKNFITRDDIVAYAEEGGDFAQLKEVDACMEAIDADMDGKVGLSDYINFAARLKEIHSLQQTQTSASETCGTPVSAHQVSDTCDTPKSALQELEEGEE